MHLTQGSRRGARLFSGESGPHLAANVSVSANTLGTLHLPLPPSPNGTDIAYGLTNNRDLLLAISTKRRLSFDAHDGACGTYPLK